MENGAFVPKEQMFQFLPDIFKYMMGTKRVIMKLLLKTSGILLFECINGQNQNIYK